MQENGGGVFTIALQPSSPAIDAGPLTGPDTDARGVVRPIDGDNDGSFLFDIGAFEAQSVPKLIVSDVTVDENAASATVKKARFTLRREMKVRMRSSSGVKPWMERLVRPLKTPVMAKMR